MLYIYPHFGLFTRPSYLYNEKSKGNKLVSLMLITMSVSFNSQLEEKSDGHTV